MPPALIPELEVSNLAASLAFYVELCGFAVAYDRPEERFAYLERDGAELMLEEAGGPGPHGIGVNLQIEVADVEALHARVAQAGAPVVRELEARWYRRGAAELGNHQFVVADPDGYLLRFFRDLGERVSPAYDEGTSAHVASYTHQSLTEVKDMAREFGMGPDIEARFAREQLGLERTGITHFHFGPNFRVPFGHRHEDQEEVYVVVSGSARIKIDDDVVELAQWDAVRVPGDTMRNLEAGPDGADVIAFGERAGEEASEMVPGWWSD